MDFDLAFYLIDHRLIALAMLAVLAVASGIGFRAGSRKRDAPESFRSLMSGIGAAMLGLLGLLLGFTLALLSCLVLRRGGRWRPSCETIAWASRRHCPVLDHGCQPTTAWDIPNGRRNSGAGTRQYLGTGAP